MSFWNKMSHKTGDNPGSKTGSHHGKPEKKKGKTKGISQWAVGLGIGVLLLTIGLCKNQFADIYNKAIMICLECIGIG